MSHHYNVTIKNDNNIYINNLFKGRKGKREGALNVSDPARLKDNSNIQFVVIKNNLHILVNKTKVLLKYFIQ